MPFNLPDMLLRHVVPPSAVLWPRMRRAAQLFSDVIPRPTKAEFHGLIEDAVAEDDADMLMRLLQLAYLDGGVDDLWVSLLVSRAGSKRCAMCLLAQRGGRAHQDRTEVILALGGFFSMYQRASVSGEFPMVDVDEGMFDACMAARHYVSGDNLSGLSGSKSISCVRAVAFSQNLSAYHKLHDLYYPQSRDGPLTALILGAIGGEMMIKLSLRELHVVAKTIGRMDISEVVDGLDNDELLSVLDDFIRFGTRRIINSMRLRLGDDVIDDALCASCCIERPSVLMDASRVRARRGLDNTYPYTPSRWYAYLHHLNTDQAIGVIVEEDIAVIHEMFGWRVTARSMSLLPGGAARRLAVELLTAEND
jgi:hypothetical protein